MRYPANMALPERDSGAVWWVQVKHYTYLAVGRLAPSGAIWWLILVYWAFCETVVISRTDEIYGWSCCCCCWWWWWWCRHWCRRSSELRGANGVVRDLSVQVSRRVWYRSPTVSHNRDLPLKRLRPSSSDGSVDDSVATALRWGGQNYRPLRQVSS